MLTVDDYALIRRAYRDGMSIRAIARTFHHSRYKVRRVLTESEPRPYTRRREASAPKLGPFQPVIDQILRDDEHAPRKQRHTAMRLFERLRDEHRYVGGYDQVRRYVGRQRPTHRETFIPLRQVPGQRAEADFGRIAVDFPDGRRIVHVLLVTWAYSDCPFALALPTERTEAILHGLTRAFDFFGCVPRQLWWDNPTTVATAILTGRQRRLHDRYHALASHFNFDPCFCMPARGNEKPRVENRVKTLQRRWATPVPELLNYEELNNYLKERCLADRYRKVTGQTETIGMRFESERQAALALPGHRFDACLSEPRKVDKFQTIAFDSNRYSVPHRQAFQTVTVKAYVDRITIVAEGRVVAVHRRSYKAGQQVLDPCHYLATLGRKPACLDQAAVFADWELPTPLRQLREELERRGGPQLGRRQFLGVLRRLEEHSLEQLLHAIEQSRGPEGPTAERIHEYLDHPGPPEEGTAPMRASPQARGEVPTVEVPRPDLGQFDRFLSSGDPSDERAPVLVTQEQPQATTTASDAGRAREVGP